MQQLIHHRRQPRWPSNIIVYSLQENIVLYWFSMKSGTFFRVNRLCGLSEVNMMDGNHTHFPEFSEYHEVIHCLYIHHQVPYWLSSISRLLRYSKTTFSLSRLFDLPSICPSSGPCHLSNTSTSNLTIKSWIMNEKKTYTTRQECSGISRAVLPSGIWLNTGSWFYPRKGQQESWAKCKLNFDNYKVHRL